MEKIIEHSEEKFKVEYFLDPDVRKEVTNPETGESYEMMLGDIEGITVYSPDGNLLGSFDYIDFDNDKAIRKIIEEHY